MTTRRATDKRRHRTFRLEEIDIDSLTASDLRAAHANTADETSPFDAAWRIWIDGEAEPAQALYVEAVSLDGTAAAEGQLGIAWGADADWGDVHNTWSIDGIDGMADIQRAIDEWLNDAEAWEARR